MSTIQEYTEASKRLIEKALISVDGQMLSDVKTLMDAVEKYNQLKGDYIEAKKMIGYLGYHAKLNRKLFIPDQVLADIEENAEIWLSGHPDEEIK